MDFKDQYKHPLWQKKRLDVLEMANFECMNCGEKEHQLHVHHLIYRKGSRIWEYETYELVALCDTCHAEAHLSKTKLNETICKFGVGAEEVAASLLSGYLDAQSYPEIYPKSFVECLGAGASYLGNLDSSDVLRLIKISPSVLQEFIREESNGSD